MDLESYLRRLEFARAPAVDLAGLERLQDRHLLGVPRHNVDLLAGKAPELSEAAALQRVVVEKGGGGGALLNVAFAALLREIGFDVGLLDVEVHDEESRSFGLEGLRGDHVALRVDLDRPYLVDVGFGPWPRQPVPFDERDDLKSYGETLRLVEDAAGLRLEIYRRERIGFVPLYRFRPEAVPLEALREGWDHHRLGADPRGRGVAEGSLAIPDGGLLLDDEGLHFRRGGRTRSEPFADLAARRTAFRRHLHLEID